MDGKDSSYFQPAASINGFLINNRGYLYKYLVSVEQTNTDVDWWAKITFPGYAQWEDWQAEASYNNQFGPITVKQTDFGGGMEIVSANQNGQHIKKVCYHSIYDSNGKCVFYIKLDPIISSGHYSPSTKTTLNIWSKVSCTVQLLDSEPSSSSPWVSTSNSRSFKGNPVLEGTLLANRNNVSNIGESSKKFANIYAYNLHGELDGNASSASSVAWSNITGKPSTFSPSSHTHDYLPLSGGTMTGNISWSTDSHGMYFYGGCGIEKWSGYGPSLVAESGTDFQISSKSDRSIRYTILHTGNWSSYCAAASHTHNYLPLSGGTITGSLLVNNGNKGTKAAITWNKSGNLGCLGFSGTTLVIGDVSGETINRFINILTDGKTGIGVNSPQYRLDVGGSFNATSIYLNGTSLGTAATHNHGDYALSGHTHDERYIRIFGLAEKDFNIPDSDEYASGVYYVHSNATQSNYPSSNRYGIIVNFNTNAGHLQFFATGDNIIKARSYWWTGGENFKGYTSWVDLIHSGNISSQSVSTATTASKLSTVSKTAWGQTYWTSGGVPTDISGAMTGVSSITSPAGSRVDIYTNDSENSVVIGQGGVPYFRLDTNHRIHIGDNVSSNDATEKLQVDGNILASSFIKSGGTSSQFLKANGSVDSNSYSLSSHNHDGTYLKLSGGTISGTVTFTSTDPIIFNQPGSGTYNKCAIFIKNGAFNLELPKETDSNSANIIPLYIKARGGQWAPIYAGGFYKGNSSDSYVLLGGGGHKAVSDFATSAHTHSYLLSSTLPENANMNSYTTTGVYGNTGTNACASFVNGPSGRPNGEMRLEVIGCNNSNAYLFQKYWARSGGSWELYLRSGYAGNWTSWIKALNTGNSSVSKSGETLTVTIGGTTQSITNTNTWRGITDSYSGTDTTISLSQKGANNLYNTLVNGYASSAGNSDKLQGYYAAFNKLFATSKSVTMTTTREFWYVKIVLSAYAQPYQMLISCSYNNEVDRGILEFSGMSSGYIYRNCNQNQGNIKAICMKTVCDPTESKWIFWVKFDKILDTSELHYSPSSQATCTVYLDNTNSAFDVTATTEEPTGLDWITTGASNSNIIVKNCSLYGSLVGNATSADSVPNLTNSEIDAIMV